MGCNALYRVKKWLAKVSTGTNYGALDNTAHRVTIAMCCSYNILKFCTISASSKLCNAARILRTCNLLCHNTSSNKQQGHSAREDATTAKVKTLAILMARSKVGVRWSRMVFQAVIVTRAGIFVIEYHLEGFTCSYSRFNTRNDMGNITLPSWCCALCARTAASEVRLKVRLGQFYTRGHTRHNNAKRLGVRAAVNLYLKIFSKTVIHLSTSQDPRKSLDSSLRHTPRP